MTRNEAIRALEYMISGDCCDTQYDFIEEIEFAIADMNAMQNNNWIGVKDRIPELSGFYLVFRPNDGMYVEYFAQHKSTWYMEDADEDYGVVYWMPLPEPPEEVSVDG